MTVSAHLLEFGADQVVHLVDVADLLRIIQDELAKTVQLRLDDVGCAVMGIEIADVRGEEIPTLA